MLVSPPMPRPSSLAKPSELFGEKDFYLEEFRGRSVLIALAPEAAAARMDLQPLASTGRDLARHDTRGILRRPGAWCFGRWRAPSGISCATARVSSCGGRGSGRPWRAACAPPSRGPSPG